METFVVSLMQILVPGIKLKIQLNPENELFPALLASLDFKCVFESSCCYREKICLSKWIHHVQHRAKVTEPPCEKFADLQVRLGTAVLLRHLGLKHCYVCVLRMEKRIQTRQQTNKLSLRKTDASSLSWQTDKVNEWKPKCCRWRPETRSCEQKQVCSPGRLVVEGGGTSFGSAISHQKIYKLQLVRSFWTDFCF